MYSFGGRKKEKRHEKKQYLASSLKKIIAFLYWPISPPQNMHSEELEVWELLTLLVIYCVQVQISSEDRIYIWRHSEINL